jgi:tetratricopeptide (TPR) repeat protein
VSDSDAGDWFWGFITGVLIAITFKLVWWLIKVTWRALVWLVRMAGQLVRLRKAKKQLDVLDEADTLTTAGRPEEALPIIQGVLNSGNRDVLPFAYSSLGTAYEQCLRWDEALEAYDRGIAFDHAEMTPLCWLGKADSLAHGKKDWEAAGEIYRRLSVPEDQNTTEFSVSLSLAQRALEGMANMLFEQGKLTDADNFCERLGRAGGSDGIRARIGRARIAARQGRYDDAVAIASTLSESDVAGLVGLRNRLFRVDDLDGFMAELHGGSRELTVAT